MKLIKKILKLEERTYNSLINERIKIIEDVNDKYKNIAFEYWFKEYHKYRFNKLNNDEVFFAVDGMEYANERLKRYARRLK